MGLEHRRLALALLLSLLIHALLLGLTFGGEGLGLPGFSLPWRDRRIEVPELRVVLVPAQVTAAEPAITSVAELSQQASTEQPDASGPAPIPSMSPAPPLGGKAAAIPPAARIAEEAKPPRDAMILEAPAKAPARADAPDQVATGPNPEPAALQVAPSDRPASVERADPAPPAPVVVVAPRASSPETAAPAFRDTRDAAPEAARLAAAQLEAQRQETARREEANRVEAARLEAERQQAARMEAAQQEAQRQEAVRQEEAARVETARLEAERREAARRESEREEAARLAAQQDAQRQVAERQEDAARVEAAERDAERQEAARQEAARQEAAQVEAQRQEAARQEEAARVETERRQAARLEAERQEAARLAASQREAQRQEAARQEEAARVEAARREAERQEAARLAAAQREAARARAEQEEATTRREAALRAIGRQLDEEAARREEASTAARLSPTLPLSLSTARRVRLWGRTDPNVELIQYAEAWARRIQLNTPVDTVRKVASRPRTDPMVTVAIRSDGSVESVTFVTSSGVAEIDETIRRIVQSHAPYPAFPPGLAREFDVIEVRRTWYFDVAIRLY